MELDSAQKRFVTSGSKWRAVVGSRQSGRTTALAAAAATAVAGGRDVAILNHNKLTANIVLDTASDLCDIPHTVQSGMIETRSGNFIRAVTDRTELRGVPINLLCVDNYDGERSLPTVPYEDLAVSTSISVASDFGPEWDVVGMIREWHSPGPFRSFGHTIYPMMERGAFCPECKMSVMNIPMHDAAFMYALGLFDDVPCDRPQEDVVL